MWWILSDSNKKFVYYNIVFILLKNNKSLKKLRFCDGVKTVEKSYSVKIIFS
jgi:hypothetical protein